MKRSEYEEFVVDRGYVERREDRLEWRLFQALVGRGIVRHECEMEIDWWPHCAVVNINGVSHKIDVEEFTDE